MCKLPLCYEKKNKGNKQINQVQEPHPNLGTMTANFSISIHLCFQQNIINQL